MTAVYVERFFWLKWAGAVIAGAAAGYLGVSILIELFGGPESLGVPFAVAFPMTLGVVGAAVGLLQSALLLRRYGIGIVGWTVATTIGFTIAYQLVFNAIAVGDDAQQALMLGALRGAVIGAVTGVAQGFVLRRRYRMPGWIVASVIGWAVAGAARDLTGGTEGGPVDLLAGFLVAGVLTGVAMGQLLRHPVKAR